jgi:hypothetical protein
MGTYWMMTNFAGTCKQWVVFGLAGDNAIPSTRQKSGHALPLYGSVLPSASTGNCSRALTIASFFFSDVALTTLS